MRMKSHRKTRHGGDTDDAKCEHGGPNHQPVEARELPLPRPRCETKSKLLLKKAGQGLPALCNSAESNSRSDKPMESLPRSRERTEMYLLYCCQTASTMDTRAIGDSARLTASHVAEKQGRLRIASCQGEGSTIAAGNLIHLSGYKDPQDPGVAARTAPAESVPARPENCEKQSGNGGSK